MKMKNLTAFTQQHCNYNILVFTLSFEGESKKCLCMEATNNEV